jgi:hypothetical protein
MTKANTKTNEVKLSSIAKTIFEDFNSIMTTLPKLTKDIARPIDKTHSLMVSLLSLHLRKKINNDQLIEGFTSISKIPYIYQPSKLIKWIEKFSFLVFNKETKTFDLRKIGNDKIRTDIFNKAKITLYSTMKSDAVKIDITSSILIDATQKDIDRLTKTIDNPKLNNDIEALKIKRTSLRKLVKDLTNLELSRNLKVAS